MPTPNDGESRKEFVSRCIPMLLEEGTAEDQDQAVAICNSVWEDSLTEEMVRGYIVGEFRGNYPDVPIDAGVDVETLTSGDDDPFFVTMPVARIGEVSRNGLLYDQELVGAIEGQMVGKGGIMGHLKKEDRSTAFPIEDVDWVGVRRVDGTTWGKAYVPPGDAREYIRRLRARGGKLATSIYGPTTERETTDDGRWRAKGFRLESLDLASADRAALRLGGQFAVTSEMQDSDDDDTTEDIMTKDELIAELTMADIPAVIRDKIVQEYRDQTDADDRISELEQEVEDRDTLISDLQSQIEINRAERFSALLDDRIAELVDWEVSGDEAQGKVDAFRRTLRSRIMAELGDERDSEKVEEVCESVWEELKPLAETLRDALAGPPAMVNGRVSGRKQKLEDTPEARAAARAKFGL